jgi:hypothetical protein
LDLLFVGLWILQDWEGGHDFHLSYLRLKLNVVRRVVAGGIRLKGTDEGYGLYGGGTSGTNRTKGIGQPLGGDGGMEWLRDGTK